MTRLRKAVGEVSAPITAGLGHDKWEIEPSEITLGKELGSGQFGVVREGVFKGGIKVCCQEKIAKGQRAQAILCRASQIAVKMMKAGAMSEDDFISEAQVMKFVPGPHFLFYFILYNKN